jgi:hypothetical protein
MFKLKGVNAMLSFEEKKAVFRSFMLKEKKISNGRINFIYPKSMQKGHVLATQLHPSGNGYVIGKYMDEETIKNNGYKVDPRGWISIRDFSKDELTQVISEAMESMSGKNISVEKAEIRQKKEKAIAITELLEKVHISTEKNVISKKPAVSKKESVPVAHASADEKIACSILANWVNLTISVMEFNSLLWRNALRKFGQ